MGVFYPVLEAKKLSAEFGYTTRRGTFVVTDASTDAERGAGCHLQALVSGHGPWGGWDAGGGI